MYVEYLLWPFGTDRVKYDNGTKDDVVVDVSEVAVRGIVTNACKRIITV